MNNFWKKLKKPFFALAPMEEVTDMAFREMFAKHGKPDVMFTEFVCVDALVHPEGRKKIETDLKYTEKQRPLVAQIWGRSPIKFQEAAGVIASMGFDGIDINMGCPQDREIKLGACAALIRQPELAREIIKATKIGAKRLPVSVKTRLGYNENSIESWVRVLLSENLAALTIHGRTKKEKSKVPAKWEEIKKAVDIKKNEFPDIDTVILGNGDVASLKDGLLKAKESGVDGVMVGRGAFGNPWVFRKDNALPGVKDRMEAMLEHARLFEKELPEKSFVIMRKHFKAYASGFEGAAELRSKLMQTKNAEETALVVKNYFESAA